MYRSLLFLLSLVFLTAPLWAEDLMSYDNQAQLENYRLRQAQSSDTASDGRTAPAEEASPTRQGEPPEEAAPAALRGAAGSAGQPGAAGQPGPAGPAGQAAAAAQVGASAHAAPIMESVLGGLFSERAGYGEFAGALAVSSAAGEVPPGYDPSPEKAVDRSLPEVEVPAGIESVIAENDVIGYYGHPNSEYMGILGEAPIPEMGRRLRELAATYDELNGERGTVPAFHIIYGTIYAEGDVGILGRDRLMEYIDYARANDIAVILDHQLGQTDAEEAVRGMLPFLQYDNVHLAIDPEWSTDRPNQEIGSVTADEVNRAQQAIQDYLVENDIRRQVMFVVHQFNWVMIENRHEVRSDFPRVAIIHNMDGFGPPQDKYRTWNFIRHTANIPLKGFKLFYPKSWRAGGYDEPLMEPEEVLALEPRPVYIQYQ